MGNAGSGQSFGDDPDCDAEHGGTAIETLGLLELFQMDFAGCSGLEPVVGGHGDLAQFVKNCNAGPLSAPIQLKEKGCNSISQILNEAKNIFRSKTFVYL